MNRSKILASRKLLGKAWHDCRQNWKLYLGIVALVSVPVNIIEAYFSPGSGLQSYLSMASLFMDVALLYAIIRKARRGDGFGIRTAYYSGSHAVLRFFIVLLWMGLMLVPLGLASDIYYVGVTSAGAASAGESLLFGLVALVIALPSFWLIGRFVLALVAVVDHEARPMTALRVSWRLTAGKFWRVLGRLIQLVLWTILVLIVPMAILGVLYAFLHSLFWLLLIQVLAALVGLPLFSLYAFYLYEDLGGSEAL